MPERRPAPRADAASAHAPDAPDAPPPTPAAWRAAAYPLACCALAALASTLAWSRLPERTPVQWGFDGAPSRWAGPLEVALLVPSLMLGVWLQTALAVRLDPRRRGMPAQPRLVAHVGDVLVTLMLALHLATLGIALDLLAPTPRVALALVGVGLAAVGNVLPRMRPYRPAHTPLPAPTSAAAHADRAGRRTARGLGRALVATGACLVAAAVAPDAWHLALLRTALALLVATVLAAVLAPLLHARTP